MSPLASIGCCCHFASRGRLRGVLATVQSGDREPHVRFDCRERGEGCPAAAGIDRTPQSQANQSVCRVSFQKLACLELPNFRRPYVVLSLEFQFHHDGVSHELNVWAHGHAGL